MSIFNKWASSICNLAYTGQCPPKYSLSTALTRTVNMEEGAYNKLIHQEDMSVDEPPLRPNRENPQVSLSVARPSSTWTTHRVLEITLAVLAAVLLAVDIGLGVYYNNLTDQFSDVTSISREVAALNAAHEAALKKRAETDMRLAHEKQKHQVIKWELEYQTKRSGYYAKQADKIQTDISILKSHVVMIEEGCRHCLPGWTFISSKCFFLSFSDTFSRRSWEEAREYCKKHDSDLAVIDSSEKQLRINQLINLHQDPSRSLSFSGFWIGLRDAESEGVWKWLDGTQLNEGYWNDGEPNNVGDEDCVATYPRNNPFKGWNDAPCVNNLKWICEMSAS
ncbi:CD209 antigen-like protein B [Syngnathoides biaculeatus]|uniref:CD209 antigen-like protein B n=1 Tax=Syngnathoides biaculeatus TaxID=300417 RepID=UPI002ADD6FB5|nr:CD209 antigen-like protein B [Syngnathoides biaculeatus]